MIRYILGLALALFLLTSVSSAGVLMSDERTEQWRRFIPRVDDPKVQAVLDDPALIIYTDNEMPRAYQKWSGGLNGIHSPYYNISGGDFLRIGNGNIEFPWGKPVGTHVVPRGHVKAFKAVYFPENGSGGRKPMVLFRLAFRNDDRPGYSWLYPVGTVFFEILTHKDSHGISRTFELRVREREQDGWRTDAFRPFATSENMANYLKTVSEWQEYRNVSAMINHLEDTRPMRVESRRDRQRHRVAFRGKAGMDFLPQLDKNIVDHILETRIFESCSGSVWKIDTNGNECYAPTIRQGDAYNIVPQKYEACFVEVSRASCMQCHTDTNVPVREFDRPRDWYGRIRGSDGILSFHPFDRSSISGNGASRRIHLNSRLTNAGLVETWNSNKHNRGDYHRLDGVH